MTGHSDLQSPLSSLHSLPGPDDIVRAELPNGIVVLARANFNSPSVVITGYLPAGGIFDPDEKLGLADFTASALMHGTARRNFQQVYDALESAGASLGIGGGTHNASFSGKALAEDLGLLFELLSEALRQPVFPQDQVERLRTQLLTGLSIRAQDTAEMASLAFDQMVYAGHPYSRPEDGYPETVQAIHQEDLAEFHRRHFGPQGLVIAVVGAVDPRQAVDRAAQALGDWQNPDQPSPPALPLLSPVGAPAFRKVTIAGKSQADIVMGAAGPDRRSPDFLAASLGNSVLGQFGMMGRIGEVVREQSGLAYYASSSLSGGLGPGPWAVSAGVDPVNVEKVIDLVRQEIARFTREPVALEELADSQANFIGRLPLSLESNGGVAAALISLERYSLGLDYYRRYPDLIRELTPEQSLEAARRYLDPNTLATAVAGP
ncbi:MAG TPA: pitrilysin family protein [Anaerolineales bacterium]